MFEEWEVMEARKLRSRQHSYMSDTMLLSLIWVFVGNTTLSQLSTSSFPDNLFIRRYRLLHAHSAEEFLFLRGRRFDL